MATSVQVLNMLFPNGGWYQVGETYEGIQFLECEAITKQQFLDGFAQYDKLAAEEAAKSKQAKLTAQAKLEALGLTADDLKALGL